ncbi:hypothetical protein SAY86_030040 [Trapa natans]|uniref:POX domain-containing protein n=1 Tax=Trapa natans TaxID=22666 RepID=A0AAN7M4M0_TRANT|nr:hypothetical protein SAY86_030040 [Trapa natans]
MGTFYMNSNDQREYTREENLSNSHLGTQVLPGTGTMMYMGSGSFSGAMEGNSEQQNSCVQMQTIGTNLDSAAHRQHEVLFMQPVGGHTGLLQAVHNLQGHGQGLSLSLGTQIPQGYAFFSPHPPLPGSNISRDGDRPLGDEQLRNPGFMAQAFVGSHQDSSRMSFSGTGRAISNSRYLKAAQQLLDEVVNVRKALKHCDEEKNRRTREDSAKVSKEGDETSKKDDGATSGAQESAGKAPKELSHAEKQDLQHKLTKLLSMLDEVRTPVRPKQSPSKSA